MTTPRIFRLSFSSIVPLTDEETKHFFSVLRKKTGDVVEIVFEQDASIYRGTLDADKKSAFTLGLISKKAVSAHRVSIAIPLLKGGGVEEIIDNATQLGVSEIHIYEGDHSVVRFAAKMPAKKKRFETCAKSAAAQSKRVSVPLVETYPNLQDLLVSQAEKTIISCVIQESKNVAEKNVAKTESNYLIVVGPEGDFSEAEQKLLEPHAGGFISLGPTILRATLAPILALAQVQFYLNN